MELILAMSIVVMISFNEDRHCAAGKLMAT
jgi:hypothetical protein